MLSDEEREALQYFNTETRTEEMHYGAVLVKLIEKQSKEIEHQIEKRANQRQELAILNAKQIEFNKLVNTVNSYKGQFKRQQKEIEELSDKLTEKICKGVEEEILEEYRQTIISKDKEIEELKEDKYGLEEEVQMQAKNIMLCENALYEIQDKIKAKIEEIDIEIQCCEYADDDTEEYKQDIEKEKRRLLRDKAVLQSLLEKE